MKILDFDPENKKDWGDLQSDISKTLVKALKSLSNGFLIVFVRRDTEEAKKVLAIMDKPTSSQRGYYWLVVIPCIRKAAEEQGQCYKDDKDLHSDIKHALKDNHGIYIEKASLLTGEVYREIISISDDKGDKENTAKYIDAVINWAAEFYGVIVPEPKKPKKK